MYPPGDYEIEIFAAVGIKILSYKYQIKLSLVETCSKATFSIKYPTNFTSQTYNLGSDAIGLYWDIDDIVVTEDTFIDCGPHTVNFFDIDTQMTPDP